MFKKHFFYHLLTGTILFCELNPQPSKADIIPDNTIPIPSKVTPDGDVRIIEGGTQQGTNLFHSFREFSFSTQTPAITGSSVNFNNDLAIKNIITRVTGGQTSTIDGLIKANGNASLFFINPQGIIFGKDASLDIGGSFIATTANSIKFLDGSEYSAAFPSQSNQLLTISTPIGLQFGSNSGRIMNQSQASVDSAVNVNGLPAGLQVKDGRTLALLGGSISLENGNLTAASGRVELGAVTSSDIVNLNETEEGYIPNYSNLMIFGDIQIGNSSNIDTSGESGGGIQIYGKNINITGDSQILSVTLGSRPGKNILINASDSVNINQGSFIASFSNSEETAGDVLVQAQESINVIGSTPDGQFPSSIASQVTDAATGKGGNLNLQTKRLLVRDGAIIDSSTFGLGQAGNISIKASDSIQIIGTDSSGILTSGIFAQVAEGSGLNTGDAGSLNIETHQLTLRDGGQISSATFSGGKGGNVNINTSDSILLSGASPTATRNKFRSGIFVSAEPGAIGDAGKLSITTGKLTVEDRAEISANNFGTGKGGAVTLGIKELIINNGGEIRASSFAEGSGGELNIKASDSINIFDTGTIGNETFPSAISSSASDAGEAGNLIVNTPVLNVSKGKLSADSASGNGGNINLTSDLLLLRRGGQITTNAGTAQRGGDGGNIDINSKFIVAIPDQNSDITANAYTGKGGNIDIRTEGIFGIEPRSQASDLTNDITASSQFGVQGNVAITKPDVDPAKGTIELPNQIRDRSDEIGKMCPRTYEEAEKFGEFTITGRGGSIPPSILEPLVGSIDKYDLVNLGEISQPTKQPIQQPGNRRSQPQSQHQQPPIIEAQGWVRNANGKIQLVDHSPQATLTGNYGVSCPN